MAELNLKSCIGSRLLFNFVSIRIRALYTNNRCSKSEESCLLCVLASIQPNHLGLRFVSSIVIYLNLHLINIVCVVFELFSVCLFCFSNYCSTTNFALLTMLKFCLLFHFINDSGFWFHLTAAVYAIYQPKEQNRATPIQFKQRLGKYKIYLFSNSA